MTFPVTIAGSLNLEAGNRSREAPEEIARSIADYLSDSGVLGVSHVGTRIGFVSLRGASRQLGWAGAGEIDVGHSSAGFNLFYKLSTVRLLIISIVMILWLYAGPLVIFGLQLQWSWSDVIDHARQYADWPLLIGWFWIFGGQYVLFGSDF